jgi:tripartite-type tricarboxylate transporter receptor subunit TctC
VSSYAVSGIAASATIYPTRPVRFISGFPAGGPVDIATRVMADWFSSDLGQQFVVEDRGGMGGNLGTQAMINSPPDGYTLQLVGASNAISASLYKKLPFDFIRDTVPVAGVMRLTNIMVVPPTLPVKTVADFIAYAKVNPGKPSFASSGNGTSLHMAGELFKALTGVEMVHVPYRGSAGAYPDLMTGKVDVMFDNLPGSIEFVRSGQLRALGVTAAKRWPSLLDRCRPVLLVTGGDTAGIPDKYRGLPCLPKPFDPVRFQELVQAVFSRPMKKLGDKATEA